jgi:hypothetical protein
VKAGRDGDLSVAEALGDHLDGHAAYQEQGGVCMEDVVTMFRISATGTRADRPGSHRRHSAALGQVEDHMAGVHLHPGQGLRPHGVEEEQPDEVEAG